MKTLRCIGVVLLSALCLTACGDNNVPKGAIEVAQKAQEEQSEQDDVTKATEVKPSSSKGSSRKYVVKSPRTTDNLKEDKQEDERATKLSARDEQDLDELLDEIAIDTEEKQD